MKDKSGKFIFIFGGARSGKSRHAVELAKKMSKKVLFIATANSIDEEMKERIRLHKLSRPRYWKLIEEEHDIDLILNSINDKYEVILIDCLGLVISNLLMRDFNDKQVENKIEKLENVISGLRNNFIIVLVSNEVGSGIVPENFLARRFRDLLGLSNQKMSKSADEVIFMQAGIPVRIKG